MSCRVTFSNQRKTKQVMSIAIPNNDVFQCLKILFIILFKKCAINANDATASGNNHKRCGDNRHISSCYCDSTCSNLYSKNVNVSIFHSDIIQLQEVQELLHQLFRIEQGKQHSMHRKQPLQANSLLFQFRMRLLKVGGCT